ncbi:hypothetical protein LEL86_03805 [Streptomyces sp. WA6-1-16]|uniref:hypothetical protein n=1 Tax=Streptomyces sp. WA6-1-16 TaxID=2879427 RepID=UPI000A24BDD8|nr:hypothetical protein [Streptomyces sp. WA6-1-16]OSC76094.1 hypothetical protein B5180_03960 [Streptomyces sp. BF-3]UCA48462.1 hypothetical protein LEL86_03805 [Streptomyces sp. WA6-1-16]
MESQCEKVLTAWAKAVADGALDADAVVEVLNHVIRENWMTGPLSTFIAGRAGTEYTSQSVVDLRERLILRWNDTRQPHPKPRNDQTAQPHLSARLEADLDPCVEIEDEA